MKQIDKKYLTVPNLLSISRLLMIPVLGYFSYKGQTQSFGSFLFIYALTDTLDGNIARKFNMTSEFGAKLDSFADDTGNTLLIPFLYLLFPFIFTDYFFFVSIIIFLFLSTTVIKVVKLKNVGLHLFSGKASQATFLIMLLYISFFSFNEIFFFLWFGVTFIHLVEMSIGLLFFKPTSDTKTVLELVNLKDS